MQEAARQDMLREERRLSAGKVVSINRGKFKLTTRIGAGSFGEIYQAVDTSSGTPVAVKLEPASCKHPQALHEAQQYRRINQNGSRVGFPRLHWYGVEAGFNAFVMDVLGPSLEDLFNFCGRRFSLKTTLMLGDQMLSRIEYMHSVGLIHRDIKPDNFLLGTGSRSHIVYVVDLGLAKRYRHERPPHRHIPFKDGKSLTGTARYASVNTHRGQEQSRRDDLEGIAYVMLYLVRGNLPWQNIKAMTKKEKYDMISHQKQAMPIGELCRYGDGTALPEEFVRYLAYCRDIHFEEEPDYAMLHDLWRQCYARTQAGEGTDPSTVPPDFQYDWMDRRQQTYDYLARRNLLPTGATCGTAASSRDPEARSRKDSGAAQPSNGPSAGDDKAAEFSGWGQAPAKEAAAVA